MNEIEIDIAHQNFSSFVINIEAYLWNGERKKDNLISVLAVVEFFSILLRSLPGIKFYLQRKLILVHSLQDRV